MRRSVGWLASGLFLSALVATPRVAAAIPILEIVFLESGTNLIEADPGDTVTAEIRLTADASGISSYGVSVRFDEDLDLAGTTELLPAGFTFNLTPGVESSDESGPGTPGHVLTFEAATFAGGPVSTTFAIGRISFQVAAPMNDGSDLVAGFFNVGIDGLFDNEGMALVEVGLGSASVVPEAGTFEMLLVGVATLAAKGRRRSAA